MTTIIRYFIELSLSLLMWFLFATVRYIFGTITIIITKFAHFSELFTQVDRQQFIGHTSPNVVSTEIPPAYQSSSAEAQIRKNTLNTCIYGASERDRREKYNDSVNKTKLNYHFLSNSRVHRDIS